MRISIVTACYNSTAFLDRIHASLKRQSYRRFEWICVDDCSSDDTVTRLLELDAPGELGMRVYRLPQNSYGPVAIALGTEVARGDVVLWLDHDDELTPDALGLIAQHWGEAGDDIIGLIFPIRDPASGKNIGGKLPIGRVLTFAQLHAEYPAAADVAIALKADVAQRHASIELMEDVSLLGVPLYEMAKSGRFLIASNEPVKVYHRDNPASQTNAPRISRKSVASYARMLDAAEAAYLRQPVRWVKHTATMVRYSKQVHGSWLAWSRFVDRPLVKAFALAAMPLGVLAHWRGRPERVVEYEPFNLTAADFSPLAPPTHPR